MREKALVDYVTTPMMHGGWPAVVFQIGQMDAVDESSSSTWKENAETITKNLPMTLSRDVRIVSEEGLHRGGYVTLAHRVGTRWSLKNHGMFERRH